MNELNSETVCEAWRKVENTSQEKSLPGEPKKSPASSKKPKTCGVYCWTHIPTGRKYVGSSKNMERRKREQVLAARWESARFFPRHLRILGVDLFSYEVIEVCHESSRLEREKYWIDRFDAVKNGFNVRPDPTVFADCYTMSEEGRKKIGFCSRNRVITEETRARLRFAKGGENHPLFGKRHSEATKFAIAIAHIGMKGSEEMRAKLSLFNKGRKFTAEHRARIGEANRRRTLSPETRKKISDKAKARYQNKNKNSKNLWL